MLPMGNCLLMSVEQNKGGMVTVIKNQKVTLLSCFMVLAMVVSLLLPVSTYYAHAEEPAILRVGWGNEPDSLSPFITYEQSTSELFLMLYDPLVGFDKDKNPVGRLAKEWSVSDDNLTWTFKLADGVKWHDGEPFTSEDVKFTYELFIETELGLYAPFLEGIEEIECPDATTVVMKTSEPKANMLMSSCPILPKHVWEKVAKDELEIWENENPIGTGAFKFGEWKKGEYVKLIANEDYFLGRPSLDGVVFVLYANNDTMAQSIKIGEIDGAININPSQVQKLKEEKNLNVIAAESMGFTELSINSWEDASSKGNPLLKDKKVRQAIDMAIDKQQILDVCYYGQGVIGTTIVPKCLTTWHYEPTGDELRSFSSDKANELLESAGYKDTDGDGIREDSNGNKLSFRLYLRSINAEEVKSGQLIKGMLAAVGIEANIETIDDGVLSDRIVDNADFDMFIWGWGTDDDPTTILNVMSSNEIGNLSDCYYSNPEYDKLLTKQATIMDEAERQKVVYEMQKILYEDSPYVILFYEDDLQAVRTDKYEGWERVPENGSYFFNGSNYNYLSLKPVSAASVAATADEGTKGGSFGKWIAIIVVAIVVISIIAKKKNNKK